MKLFQVYYLLIFLSLTATSTADPFYAKPQCKDTCGDVKIPYPFGIGANCSLTEWYSIDCNSTTPYLSALNNVEVLDINLGNQTVTVNASMIISECQNLVRHSSRMLNIDLGGSPFLFSRLHNKFVVEGCGNAVIMDRGSAVTGCSTTCPNNTVSDNKCLGVSCCQTTIPYYLRSYTIDLTGLERQGGGGACGSAFLVEENSYVEGMFSRQSITGDNSYVPISLLWTLSYNDCNQTDCCHACDRVNADTGGVASWYTLKVDLGNGTSVESGKCSLAHRMEGNPYISDGSELTQECASCKDSGGFCDYDEIYDDDGQLKESNFNCSYNTSYSNNFASLFLALILGHV